MPAEFECIKCSGYDESCTSCKGLGHFKVTRCPKMEVDRRSIGIMRLLDMADRHLPLSGGMLEQTQSFIDLLDWWENEKKRWENLK